MRETLYTAEMTDDNRLFEEKWENALSQIFSWKVSRRVAIRWPITQMCAAKVSEPQECRPCGRH
jgi:hypothetical protein